MENKPRAILLVLTAVVMLVSVCVPLPAADAAPVLLSDQRSRQSASYLGFDRNDYPGDASLAALHKTFAFTGYWLSNPPGESFNSWQGKRTTLERAGFGFLLLFNGRSYAELKTRPNLGASDGVAASRAARAEGFRLGSVIFLDQEQGGRMLELQKQYIFAWAAAVKNAGFRPGIYCSGIAVAEPDGSLITTARDLHDSAQGSELVFWVANDTCPPSPGCVFPKMPPPPHTSGTPFAEVWQFAQSPLRLGFASACAASYNPDRNCYAPGMSTRQKVHIDVNVARTPDPSHARD